MARTARMAHMAHMAHLPPNAETPPITAFFFPKCSSGRKTPRSAAFPLSAADARATRESADARPLLVPAFPGGA